MEPHPQRERCCQGRTPRETGEYVSLSIHQLWLRSCSVPDITLPLHHSDFQWQWIWLNSYKDPKPGRPSSQPPEGPGTHASFFTTESRDHLVTCATSSPRRKWLLFVHSVRERRPLRGLENSCLVYFFPPLHEPRFWKSCIEPTLATYISS